MTPSSLSIKLNADTNADICEAASVEEIQLALISSLDHDLSSVAIAKLASILIPLSYSQRLKTLKSLRKASSKSNDFRLGQRKSHADFSEFQGKTLIHQTRASSKFPSHGEYKTPADMKLKDFTEFLDNAKGISRDHSKYYEEWGLIVNGQWRSIKDIKENL
jgi:hypothetical protein